MFTPNAAEVMAAGADVAFPVAATVCRWEDVHLAEVDTAVPAGGATAEPAEAIAEEEIMPAAVVTGTADMAVAAMDTATAATAEDTATGGEVGVWALAWRIHPGITPITVTATVTIPTTMILTIPAMPRLRTTAVLRSLLAEDGGISAGSFYTV